LQWTGKAHRLPAEGRDDLLSRLRYLCHVARVSGIDELQNARNAGCRQM